LIPEARAATPFGPIVFTPFILMHKVMVRESFFSTFPRAMAQSSLKQDRFETAIEKLDKYRNPVI